MSGPDEFFACATRILRVLQRHRWRWLALILLLVLGLHRLFGTLTILRSNTDWRPSDQLAENYLAVDARSDPFPAQSDGVRHPLWSWTVGHAVYHPDHHFTFFVRGKWLNTCFVILFLAVLGVIVSRWLDALATLNLLLLSSLGILLVRGVYFQPEPLYYIFFFLSGLLAFRILRGAKAWEFAAFGVTSGLAYLAKPSLLPFLLAFAAAFALRLALGFARPDPAWRPGRNLAGVVGSGLLFGLLILPLALYTAEHYGRPLFNYTKHWMWMDDFDNEAYPFQVAHPGKWELEKIPKEELPGPAWYFRRHSVSDALTRGVTGSVAVVQTFFFPEDRLRGQAFFWRWSPKHWRQPLAHRGVYLIGLALLGAVLLWPVRQEVALRLRDPGWLSSAVLVLAAGSLYIGLYGWYYPVGKGDRFMGSLWIPAVTLACWMAARLRNLDGPRWRDAVYLSAHLLFLISLLLQIASIGWLFWQGHGLSTRN